tara:strand:+ start:502 stop:813 length:312 start_codon:yes stop_codon:yes gene_type:complete
MEKSEPSFSRLYAFVCHFAFPSKMRPNRFAGNLLDFPFWLTISVVCCISGPFCNGAAKFLSPQFALFPLINKKRKNDFIFGFFNFLEGILDGVLETCHEIILS